MCKGYPKVGMASSGENDNLIFVSIQIEDGQSLAVKSVQRSRH